MSCRTVLGASFQNWSLSLDVVSVIWSQNSVSTCVYCWPLEITKTHFNSRWKWTLCVCLGICVCVFVCACVCSCHQTSEAALCVLSSLRRSDISPAYLFVCLCASWAICLLLLDHAPFSVFHSTPCFSLPSHRYQCHMTVAVRRPKLGAMTHSQQQKHINTTWRAAIRLPPGPTSHHSTNSTPRTGQGPTFSTLYSPQLPVHIVLCLTCVLIWTMFLWTQSCSQHF